MDAYLDKVKKFMLKPDEQQEAKKQKTSDPTIPSEVDPTSENGYPPTKVPNLFKKYLPEGQMRENVIAFYVWVDQQPQHNKARFLFYAAGFWFAFFFVILFLHVVSHGGTRATGSTVSHDASMPHRTTIVFTDLADADDYLALSYLLKRPDVSVPLIVVPGGGGTGDVHGSQTVENLRAFLCRVELEAATENARMNAGTGEEGRNRRRKRLMPMVAMGSSISLADRNYTYDRDMSPSGCATQRALWHRSGLGEGRGSSALSGGTFVHDKLRFLADSAFGVGQYLHSGLRRQQAQADDDASSSQQCLSNAEVITSWKKAKRMENYDLLNDADEGSSSEADDGEFISGDDDMGRVPSAASMVQMVLEGQMRQAERFGVVGERSTVSLLLLGSGTDLADAFYIPEDDPFQSFGGDSRNGVVTTTALGRNAAGPTESGRRIRQQRIAALRRTRRMVSQVVVSGGFLPTSNNNGAGNVGAERFGSASANAEVNFFRDPEAARLLLEGRMRLPNVQVVHWGAVSSMFPVSSSSDKTHNNNQQQWWSQLVGPALYTGTTTATAQQQDGSNNKKRRRRPWTETKSLCETNLMNWIGLAAYSQQQSTTSSEDSSSTVESQILRPMDTLAAMIVSSERIRREVSVATPSSNPHRMSVVTTSLPQASISPTDPSTSNDNNLEAAKTSIKGVDIFNYLSGVGVVGYGDVPVSAAPDIPRPHVIMSIDNNILWEEFFGIVRLPWPV